jgi:outer membrane protein OmpA-like peptidoglycan-associated protein
MDYSYILTYVFTPQPIVMMFPEAALFDFDKAELKPAGKEEIKAYRDVAKEQLSRADKIKISGHTDNIGTADYNMKLSQRRAEAVSEYLKRIGVDPSKMEVAGEGMSRPVADSRTKEGRAKNRRELNHVVTQESSGAGLQVGRYLPSCTSSVEKWCIATSII